MRNKVSEFKDLTQKYFTASTSMYFNDAYERIYDYLHNHKDYTDEEYCIDYGRLWGMMTILNEMIDEADRELLFDLIVLL